MALDPGVLDSVANTNFKSLADGPAFFMNQLMSDSLTAQRNVSAVREKSLARSLERMDVTNDDEGVVNSGGQLATLVALAQQLMKGAQTTIPVTAVDRPA